MVAKKRTARGRKPEIELDPDAWPRFERFIKDAAKVGPKHREAVKGKQGPKAGKKT